MTALVYVLAYGLIPFFGVAAALPIESRSARIGFAFLAGMLLLTIEATLFPMIGIRWSIAGLALPLLLLSGATWWMRRNRTKNVGRTLQSDASITSDWRVRPAFQWFAFAVIVASLLHFLFSILTTQSINPDYVLFWGTKSVHFAMARTLDASYLLSRFAPPRIDYPPLIPITQAWGLLFSHSMPWITAAAMAAVWLAAAVPVIRWLTGSDEGTALWTAAMAASLAFSGSGGNAEAMLVVYLSVGAAAIVAGRTSIAAIAFAGAMLTKEEALVTIGAVLIGVVIHDRGIRRAAILAVSSAAGTGVWFAFQKRFGLPVGYQRVTLTHAFHWGNLPTIFHEAPKSLAAGCWGLSWLIPLAILLVIAVKQPRRLTEVVPLLVPIPLLFGFFVYLYLQYDSSLAMKMWWILPRLSQPALSLLVLAATVASGARMQRHER
jgi:hypothetical protein